MKENNLNVKIIGAADSKTGTPKHNRALSVKRAKYIAKLLMKAGVDKSKMQGISSLTKDFDVPVIPELPFGADTIREGGT